jgi:hypothetical protein
LLALFVSSGLPSFYRNCPSTEEDILAVWLALALLVPVNLRLAWLGGDALGHGLLRHRLRQGRTGYRRTIP